MPADLVPDDGRLAVAYFGYLSCPDVCPTTMADLRLALRELEPAEAARVDIAFVTVDPERDSGADVSEYLGLYFDEGDATPLALRADGPTELADAADQLGVYYEVEDHEPGAERYDVGHSAVAYVVDETGSVVRELPFGATAEEFAQVLRHNLAA